jgi:PCFT/HCP family folate transporter-like MFS transporter 1/3
MSDEKKTVTQAQDAGTGKTPFKNMTNREKWKYFTTNITVEPMLACYIVPCVLAMLATQNLNLEKACRVNLKYDETVCAALTARQTANYTEQETQVQQLVAGMTIWKTAVQSALPCLLMLFLGSWSDRHGTRKPCMLLPITGEFLTCIGLILCTYFFFELPMEVAGLVEALFPALTGGWFTMFMAIFSYIADVTTIEMRTLRIGIVNLFVSLGVPVGMALSGVLYAQIGFYGIFSISATMYVMSFCYGFFRVKEAPRQKTEEEKKRQEAFKHQRCGFVRDFFDIRHISDTFRVAFKEGKNNRKRRVIMLMIACMVIIGPLHGESLRLYSFEHVSFVS